MEENKEFKEEGHSREFLERKELVLLDRANIELKHKYKMEELEFDRESSRKFHEHQKEMQRIKSAEIQKSQQRREFNYHKHWEERPK